MAQRPDTTMMKVIDTTAPSAVAAASAHVPTGSTAAHRRIVVMTGPSRAAVSGVSTHLNQLFGAGLDDAFELVHFQVGSEGRRESGLQKLARFLFSPWALRQLLAQLRPAILHLNTALETKAFWRDIAYLLVARTLRIPVVYQVHGGRLPAEMLPFGALGRAVVRTVLRMPQAVVLLAEAERIAYRAFDPSLPVTVVANAIDVRAQGDWGRTRDATAGAPLRLLCLGRIARVKGFFDAVEAAALLRARGVPFELAIAGSGPDEAALCDRIAALGLGDAVRFAGAVFGEAKQRLWAGTDVFVFPTYHREGLPYALLEAMLAGAIPVTCPVGAIPDVMTDRRHGIFVPDRDPPALADAIQWLHEHREEAAAMQRAGRERVLEAYSVARLAADFRTLYGRL